jgi:LPS export ABC transporter permease LptG
MLEQAERLLAKGVSLPTIGALLMTLLPQSLGITIPMAFLTALLMAMGRLSADREAVALLACGVSPARILRPVMAFALVAAAANAYILTTLVPDSNQRFREITFALLLQQGENDIKPGVFFEGFPGKVIHIRESRPGGGWLGVTLADTSQPGPPTIITAREGFLDVDQVRRQVAIVLPGESSRYQPGDDGVYDTARAVDLRLEVDAASVFGSGDILPRGRAEMTIADLRRVEAEKVAAGVSPHPEIMFRHQMFSFPVACLVFALVGVALGLHTRKEGRLGGFALGIGVIFVYYGVMQVAEALTKGGRLPAEWARWIPNITVALLGLWALRSRMRNTGREWTITLPGWAAKIGRRPRATTSQARGDTMARPDGAPVVLVIRVPDLELPRPRLLDRYVSRRYLAVGALSFFGMLGLYYVGTLIDKAERLFKGEASAAMLLDYFYYSTPQFIAYVAPMATLIAVLATIGGLMRSSELVVMRACGVSLYRAGAPLLCLALVWSGGLFLLDDRVLAHANRRAESLEDQIRGNPSHTVNTLVNANWLADPDGRIYHYTAFDPSSSTLLGLSIFEPAPDANRMIGHTFIDRAVFTSGGWRATGGWRYRFEDAEGSVRSVLPAGPLDIEPPENFSGMHNRTADLMSYGDLRTHIEALASSGFNITDSRVELARRMAFPFVTIVMTILGIPFGVTTGRRGALYGVGLALVLGAGYWLVDTMFIAIGQAGLLTPWLAAWAANLLFAALAVYAILTVRT